MISYYVTSLAFFALYLYAIRLCFAKRKIEAQPATLGLYLFFTLLVEHLLSLILITLLQNKPDAAAFTRIVFKLIAWMNWGLFLGLLAGMLGWRKSPQNRNKMLIKWASAALALKLIGTFSFPISHRLYLTLQPDMAAQAYFGIVSVFTTLVHLAAYTLIINGFFRWRGYPEPAAALAASLASDSTKTTSSTVATAPGLFKEADFIPYLCGVMILGGLIAIPMVWGMMHGIGYGQALLPALVSCGIFAASHNKRGHFLWMRFLLMMLFFSMQIMKTANSYSHTRPMFLAGGFLGFLIMSGCGWAGIFLARKLRSA